MGVSRPHSRFCLMLAKFLSCLIILLLTAPALAQLPPTVAIALRAAQIAPENVAVVVQMVDAPAPLLTHNPGKTMNPASVMKLLTTYAALDLLGPAYTWQTALLTTATQNGARLEGNLYFRGSGDPRLTVEQLWLLLRQLRTRGIAHIAGDIVLDRSSFASIDFDPAAFDNKPLRAYNVGPNALLLDFQTLRFTLRPDAVRPQVWLDSPSNGLKLDNRLRNSAGPCPADWRDRIQPTPIPEANGLRLEIRGEYAQQCGERSIHLAPLTSEEHARGLILALWQELGGRIDGSIRSGTTPSEASLLLRHESAVLADVVRDINKYSNNVMARQLFLTLGNDAAPATDAQAVRRINEWLRARQLQFPELVLDNGSGLSRQERISAANMNRLLLDAWRSPLMPEFIASLPLAGTDGTMKRRLQNAGAAGRAHIKTGTLNGVRTAAGYVLDTSGRRYALTIFINDPRAQAGAEAIDALLNWLATRSE